MKKKVLSTMLAVVMTASLLTACGGGKSSETAAPAKETAATEAASPTETKAPEAEEPAKEEAPAEETETEGEMVSDETFAQLQENFQIMSDCYDAVLEAYSSDEIAADADIEEAMTLAAEIIDEMGEITQDSITEEDAEVLNESMYQILTGLSDLVDGMEVVDNSAGDTGDTVSDETFAILQDNYKLLTETYNAVAEAYNSDEIAANAEIESTMTEAADIIEEMGNIDKAELTESDAEDLNEAMRLILEGLAQIANSMG